MAKVLAVEDDPDVLGLVQARLKRDGHQVMGASSGADALRVTAERGQPDVVVLDVGLPDMSGLELLDSLRAGEASATLPAVFLSGGVTPEEVAAGRAKGATYLTKPFVASALLDAVTKALATVAPPEVGDGW